MKFSYLLVVLPMAVCSAQEQRFVAPLPPANAVSVQTALPYMKGKESSLLLDFYRPAQAAAGERLPVLVFLNGFGGMWLRDSPQAQGWARAATAHGFAAVVEDTETGKVGEDFDALASYLKERANELEVDPERIAVMAWSGNVDQGLPLAENERSTAIKAAVFLYGVGEVTKFRLGLPVLFVRAGLDRAGMNRELDSMIAAGLAANAPWTVLNYPAGHHGFDLVDDNELSREIVEQVFRFVQSATAKTYQAGLRSGLNEAAAAGALARGDYAQAISLYGTLAAARPKDFRLLLSYGEALLGGKQYRAARVQFERVREIGGAGPRDLGVPAAKACALDNDPDAAIAWLKTIPPQFLPSGLQLDPAFAVLRKRADFAALFDKR